MIDRESIQLVRSVAHAVFGVDIAERTRKPAVCRPRHLAMMALHDELGANQTEASAAFGHEPSMFTHARSKLVRLLEADANFRAKACLFFRVLDQERQARLTLAGLN